MAMVLPILAQIRQAIKAAIATAQLPGGASIAVTAAKRLGVQPTNGLCVIAIASDKPLGDETQQIARREAIFKVVTWVDYSENLESTQDADDLLAADAATIQMAIMPNETASHLGGLAEGTWAEGISFGIESDYYTIEQEFRVQYRTLYFNPFQQG